MDISRQALQLKKALNESRYTVAITSGDVQKGIGGAACQWHAFSADRSGSGERPNKQV